MNIDNFNDLYLAELQELGSVESQHAQSPRSMAEMASRFALKKQHQNTAYGIAAAFAGRPGLRDAEHVHHESLEEEKRADAMRNLFVKREVNPNAVA